MLYNPPSGSTDPNASYVGKNTAAGTQGSRVPPAAIESVQREIVATIAESGLSPTNTDLRQLLKAIRSGKLFTFPDVGTVNALSIQPLTPHTVVFLGLPFRVIPAFTCTGPATLTLGTFAPAQLVRRDGSALVIGDYVAGVPIDVWNDGLGRYRLMDVAFGEVPRLVSSLTLYVRSDGSDLNDGSANDAGHAFATLAAAIARGTSRYALAGGTLTIKMGLPGSYAPPGPIPPTQGTLIIEGDTGAQGSFILDGPGPAGGNSGLVFTLGGAVKLRGLTLRNTGTINHSLNAGPTSAVTCEFVTFTSTTSAGFAHMQSGGSIVLLGGCIVASSMTAIGVGIGAGSINIAANLTLANTPNFSTATFAAVDRGGVALFPNVQFLGTGATGPRYFATQNAVILSYGAGPNAFPGSTAGSTSNGGLYV